MEIFWESWTGCTASGDHSTLPWDIIIDVQQYVSNQTNQRREKLTTIGRLKVFLLRNYISPFRDESRSRPLPATLNASNVLNQMRSKKKHRLKPKRVKKTNKRLIGAYRLQVRYRRWHAASVSIHFFNKIKKNLINFFSHCNLKLMRTFDTQPWNFRLFRGEA